MADDVDSAVDPMSVPDDPSQAIQMLLPDEVWAAYFTVPRLRAWLPAAGAWGVSPMLRLLTLPWRQGRVQEHDVSLDSTRFDLIDERPHLLTDMGEQVAASGRQVLGVLLRSEAWARVFSAEEYAARHGRPVSSYDDKLEIALVGGLTLDGRVRHAQTPITRRASECIAGYGPWTISEPGQGALRLYILEDFWRGYVQGIQRRTAR